jgi:hypothetical protein
VAPDSFDHLRFTRLEPVNSKRKKGGFGRPVEPDDPQVHAQKLLDQLAESANAQQGVPGFDPRLLVKLQVEGIPPDNLETIPGIQLVSQEEKAIVVVFVDDAAKGEFHRRLQEMTQGKTPTRKDVLYAIKGVENWQRKDRLGPALELGYGKLPTAEPFVLDLELWPLERSDQRKQMLEAFVGWSKKQGIVVLDSLDRETLVLLRVQATRLGIESILEHRDVRTVDLPPRIHLDFGLAKVPMQEIAPIQSPPENAPRVAILDSGIAAGHPLIGPAVGDAQSFLNGKGPHDEYGHGTMVAGLVLYGDVAQGIESRRFAPEFWLLSGRVTDENNRCDDRLIEKQVVAAVESFVADYGCRVFNLSLGDEDKLYAGGHVGPWASLLDELARVHQVLFIVSAGNFRGTDHVPQDWLKEYPDYLLDRAARLIDPAPALNALTVGSLARHEKPRMSQHFPNDPAYRPIARADEPSPFSRSGFSVGKAIKPELVEYGGNWHVDARVSSAPVDNNDLGEVSTSLGFLPGNSGNLFHAGCGTSFSAPRVAWLAGMLLKKYPNASANLLRALLVAHARVPEATRNRLATGDTTKDEERVLQLAGFGRPDVDAALASTERRVTLVAESDLEENHCHFFEIPVPDDFVKPPHRRPRRITISLAHTPLVRRTRLDYKGSEFSFRLERQQTEDRVFALYKRAPPNTKQEKLRPELGDFRPTAHVRNNGTVQAATWLIGQTSPWWTEEKLFVVVTRTVPEWALGKMEKEPYALTVVLEDRSKEQVHLEQVHLYTQIRERLRERGRVRT